MKLLDAQQIKKLDELTIQHEPVSSVNLMERAAKKCVDFITKIIDKKNTILVFCGKGNNGGDGLAIARMLLQKSYVCEVVVLPNKSRGSTDYEKNLLRLRKIKKAKIHPFSPDLKIETSTSYVIIDALLGTGFSGHLRDDLEKVIDAINQSGFPVISIDIPSGLPAEPVQKLNAENVVHANFTLTFHVPKHSMLCKPGSELSGEIILLDIGLSAADYHAMSSREFLILPHEISQMVKARPHESAKWDYGHALLIAGNNDKPGAAMLGSRACLKTGAGLCTLLSSGNVISKSIQHTPELMGFTWENPFDLPKPEWLSKFAAIGIGPGCGTDEEFKKLLKWLLQFAHLPLVIDADALNILAQNKTWLAMCSSPKILTPHFREFCRLTNCSHHAPQPETDENLRELSRKFNAVVVLKSAYTRIAFPTGNIYINFTGNAGLAKAGSGDVLTGIITSLLAQNYSVNEAALLGVCLHGLAADLALETQSHESMLPSDVTNCLPHAFKHLHKLENT
jgi:NAD(P)H-hydrate epimerase